MITEKQVHEVAEFEGWGIFGENDDQIQTLDEGPSHGPLEGKRQFDTDQHALAHVIRRAGEGSSLHAKALEMINYQPGPPTFQVEVHETRAVKKLYIVEAATPEEAIEKARKGNTVDEHEMDDGGVVDREVMPFPRRLT